MAYSRDPFLERDWREDWRERLERERLERETGKRDWRQRLGRKTRERDQQDTRDEAMADGLTQNNEVARECQRKLERARASQIELEGARECQRERQRELERRYRAIQTTW